MTKKRVLVNEEELRTLIDGLDLKDKQKNEYLKARWLNYVLWWDSRATLESLFGFGDIWREKRRPS